MNFFRLKLFLLTMFSISNSKVINEATSWQLTELINGVKFKAIEKVDNGRRQELFYIDNKDVSKDEFNSIKLNEAAKEVENQLKKSQEERDLAFKFNYESKLKLLKKLIFLKIQDIKENISKLEKYDISDFYIFCNETILNGDDYNEMKESLEDINKMINSGQHLVIHDFESILSKLEIREQKIISFIRKALENAINKCDDAKILKNLLEII